MNRKERANGARAAVRFVRALKKTDLVTYTHRVEAMLEHQSVDGADLPELARALNRRPWPACVTPMMFDLIFCDTNVEGRRLITFTAFDMSGRSLLRHAYDIAHMPRNEAGATAWR